MWALRVCLCCLLVSPASAQSEVIYSLRAPSDALRPGQMAELELIALNPGVTAQAAELPAELSVELQDATGQSRRVQARVLPAHGGPLAAGAFARHRLQFPVPPEWRGNVVVALSQPQSARTVVTLEAPIGAEPGTDAWPTSRTATTAPPGREPEAPALADTQFRDHFGAHEPVYFVYGRESPNAKFQFSFKYRLFGLAEDLIESLPALRGIHFGYTQRSLWDIGSESGPFYDTSYIPELFYESAYYVSHSGGWLHWLGFQAGVRHESNGRAGLESRSLNMAYVRPTLAVGDLDGWRLIFSPTFFSYITTLRDNPDLRDYRGYLEVRLALGQARSWELAATARMGEDFENVGLQADLTVPITIERVGFSTYLILQYFNGYGESFLRYRERTSSWRAGVSFVR